MLTPGVIPGGQTLAIAFSGGGDSTALVHMLRDYSPAPLVLIVDHNLRGGSRCEAETAQKFAQNLGLEARILTWGHDSPKTGLQEKARRARYALMGEACREVGIEYLLTGHTQDDQAETLLMRYARGTGWRGAAGMAERVYAPLWPALANVTVLRPLMGQRRQALRDYNTRNGLNWSEDPSNENRGFSRIQARDYLRGRANLRQTLLETGAELRRGLEIERQRLAAFARENVDVDDFGLIRVERCPPERLLAMLLQAASGTGAPVDRQALRRLKTSMMSPEFSGATLSGAMTVRGKSGFLIGRDPVAGKGRGNTPVLPTIHLKKDKQIIWDGRFLITARLNGLRAEVTPQALPLSSPNDPKLSSDFMLGVPHQFRQTMPAVWSEANELQTLPGRRPVDTRLDSHLGVSISSLVAPRLHKMLCAKAFETLYA